MSAHEMDRALAAAVPAAAPCVTTVDTSSRFESCMVGGRRCAVTAWVTHRATETLTVAWRVDGAPVGECSAHLLGGTFGELRAACYAAASLSPQVWLDAARDDDDLTIELLGTVLAMRMAVACGWLTE